MEKIHNEKNEVFDAYVKQVSRYPLLTFNEEKELSTRIQQGDKVAREKLINSNLRLVIRIAKFHNKKHKNSFMDLIQEGNCGLMAAAERYVTSFNVRFSTYACYWIRQAMSKYLNTSHRVIRLPVMKELHINAIKKARQFLEQELSREPTDQDISNETGISVKEIKMLQTMESIASLNTVVSNEGEAESEIIDFLEDDTFSPENVVASKIARDEVRKMIETLPDRKRFIITERYLYEGKTRPTLRDLGDILEISHERVRQIEKETLNELCEIYKVNAQDLLNLFN